MAIIKIREHDVDVEIEEELRNYDWGFSARWSTGKLIASSPFRDDSTPSFFVNLEGEYAGYFGDSGAIDEYQSSGHFVTLLAYLRGETESETTEYLLSEYGRLYTDSEDIRLPTPKLTDQRNAARMIPDVTISQATSAYLTKRGISAEVQAQFGTGYNEQHYGYTAIPWRLPDGRIGNVKYRSTAGKRFFFEKDATPVREIVYGIDLIDGDFAVICEGEIDAMSWRTAGVPAIALGGANISREQADMIRRSSLRTLALGGDNDGMGALLNERVKRELRWDLRMVTVDYDGYKDANDVLLAEGTDVLRRLVKVTNGGNEESRLIIRNNAVI